MINVVDKVYFHVAYILSDRNMAFSSFFDVEVSMN